jgi:hypothetical protein
MVHAAAKHALQLVEVLHSVRRHFNAPSQVCNGLLQQPIQLGTVARQHAAVALARFGQQTIVTRPGAVDQADSACPDIEAQMLHRLPLLALDRLQKRKALRITRGKQWHSCFYDSSRHKLPKANGISWDIVDRRLEQDHGMLAMRLHSAVKA